MHVYIYDSFLNQKKYDRVLANIETRLTDLGLNGKINRLNFTRNIEQIVDYEIKSGAKTIVAVGDDKTINQVANYLVGSNIALGIIPVGKDRNEISKNFGIASEADACEILSARRIIKIDLGIINGYCFLNKATITTRGTIIEISRNYSIEVAGRGKIKIMNLPDSPSSGSHKTKISPQDGLLELIIETIEGNKFFSKVSSQSFFHLKKLHVKNKLTPIILDGSVEVNLPGEVNVIKQKFKVIVGKKRSF